MNRPMNHPIKPLIAALRTACALLLLPTMALAHHTWLLPSTTVVDDKEATVTVDAAVSEDLFEIDTNAMQLDTLRITAPDGRVLAPESRHQGRRRTSFEVKLPQPGTYRIAGVAEAAMASYKVGTETKRWRGPASALQSNVPADAQELQITHTFTRVETFVSQGEPGATVPAPQGTGLELLPLTSPTDLSTGDTSRFRLLQDGKPAPQGVDVTLVRAGHRYRYKMAEISLKTDAQGEFSVTWVDAGRYWLGASVGGRPAMAPGMDASTPQANAAPVRTGQAAAPIRRASYSATFEVLPR